MNRKKITISILFLVILSSSLFFVLGDKKNIQKNTKTDIEQTFPEKSSEKLIIAFGDSLTAGYGLPEAESYPRQLEKKLRENGIAVKVINSGVSGETTAGNKERASFISSQNADIVLLGIGGNDALRFLKGEETFKNIDESVRILQSNGKTKVILLSMQAPLNVGAEYKKDFDSLYQKIAEKHSLLVIPFITPEIFLNQDLKLSDGIHLNKEGYAAVVEAYIYPALYELLKEGE